MSPHRLVMRPIGENLAWKPMCIACMQVWPCDYAYADPRACDECGAKLFPGDWLTRDGCCWCDGEDVLI